LRYGTPPVVRATGGLADTVTDTTDATLQAGTATGFRFGPYDAGALVGAVHRAVALYRHRPEDWRKVMLTGMSQDWSWDKSAAEYERLYEKLRKRAPWGPAPPVAGVGPPACLNGRVVQYRHSAGPSRRLPPRPRFGLPSWIRHSRASPSRC